MENIKMFIVNGGLSLVGSVSREEESYYECENLIALAQGPQSVGVVPFPLGVKEDGKVKLMKQSIMAEVEKDNIEEMLIAEYTKVTSKIEIVKDTSKIVDIKNFN